jgi:hypothetical protein
MEKAAEGVVVLVGIAAEADFVSANADQRPGTGRELDGRRRLGAAGRHATHPSSRPGSQRFMAPVIR